MMVYGQLFVICFPGKYLTGKMICILYGFPCEMICILYVRWIFLTTSLRIPPVTRSAPPIMQATRVGFGDEW